VDPVGEKCTNFDGLKAPAWFPAGKSERLKWRGDGALFAYAAMS